MICEKGALPGVLLVKLKVFGDARGAFYESYRKNVFAEFGVADDFVQDNQSFSTRHVLRGLHYQLRRPQAKLVRVLAGSVVDAVVDIRRGSPSFGGHQLFELRADRPEILYVPAGFAHGFFVTSDTAVVAYKCSDYYDPEDANGLPWNDPDLGVAWPVPPGVEPVVSDKDRGYAALADTPPEALPAFPF